MTLSGYVLNKMIAHSLLPGFGSRNLGTEIFHIRSDILKFCFTACQRKNNNWKSPVKGDWDLTLEKMNRTCGNPWRHPKGMMVCLLADREFWLLRMHEASLGSDRALSGKWAAKKLGITRNFGDLVDRQVDWKVWNRHTGRVHMRSL